MSASNISANAVAVVDLDGKKASDKITELQNEGKELLAIIKELSKAPVANEKALKHYNSLLVKNNKEQEKHKRELIDVRNVMSNLSGASINQLKAAYRQLQKQQQSLAQTDPKFKQHADDLKILDAQIKKATGSFKEQEGVMSRMANGFSKYSGIFMSAVASMTGVSLALNKAITYANDREEGLDYLQSLTGLSEDAVAEMEQMAIKASTSVIDGNVRIRQSADDIVAAYTVVGSQRPELLKNSQALHQVTQDAIILSEAAKMDLDPATRALTNTLNQFTLSADQSRRVINILAAGSQAGSADIEYLSEAIEKVGTTANLMGISVEETVGAIEAIGPFYAEASMAGNSFDKVLLKLKANQIGYKDGVFDLNTAILEMEQRFANGESAVDLFGVEHAKMAELLVQNRDQVINYTQAVTGSNKAIEQASINTNNNASKLDQAKNKAKEYAIELGKKLQPAFASIVSKGALLLKTLSTLIDVFIRNKGVIIPLIAAIGAYVAVTKIQALWLSTEIVRTNLLRQAKLLYGTVVKLLTGQINLATAAQKAFNVAGAANPWGLIVAGIVAAVTALAMFYNKTKETSEMTSEISSKLATESVRINALFDALENTNTTQEQRKKLMADINEEYGKYLPVLLTEENYLNRVAEARAAVIAGLKAEIESKVMQETAAKMYARMDEIQNTISGETNDFWGTLETWVTGQNVPSARIATLLTEYGDLKKQYDAIYEKIADIMANPQTATTTIPPKENDMKIINGVMHIFKGGKWIVYNPTPPDDDDDKDDNNNADEIKRQLFDREQYEEALIDNLAIDWANYLTTRANQDQTYWEWKNENDKKQAEKNKKAALEGLEIAKQEELNLLLESYSKGEIDAAEYEARKAQIIYASLENEKAIRIAFGDDVKSIEQQQFEYEMDLLRQSYEQRKKMMDKVKADRKADIEKEKAEIKDKYELYMSVAGEMGEAVGKIMGDTSKDTTEKFKEIGKQLLLITLKTLKNQLTASIASATLQSIASAESVATWGIAGVAKAALLTAALEGAYALASAKLGGFQSGGYTGGSNPSKIAGVTHQDEYVIPSKGLRNPVVASITSAIEAARKSNRLDSLSWDTLMQLPALRSGGYSSQQTSNNKQQTNDSEIFNKINQTLMILNTTNSALSDKIDDIEAKIYYDKQKISDTRITNSFNKSRLTD